MKIDNYVFIPMSQITGLTRKAIKSDDDWRQSQDLLSFNLTVIKSLCHWKQWLYKYTKNYKTSNQWIILSLMTQPVLNTGLFTEHLKENSAFIFLDPDTVGKRFHSYLRKMGREKYILNHEVELLYHHLDLPRS